MSMVIRRNGTSTERLLLSDRAYAALREAIITGALPPGSKISEPMVARRFGISRGPLREAIRRLEERQLVTRVPQRGVRVVELSAETLIDIFLVREVLEGLAARLAAERISQTDIDDLHRLLDAHETALDASDIYYQRDRDWDFHYRIAVCSGSRKLAELLGSDFYQLVRLYRYQHALAPGRARRAWLEHRSILAAIADRDGELAEFLMRRHVATARTVVQTALLAAGTPARGGGRGETSARPKLTINDCEKGVPS